MEHQTLGAPADPADQGAGLRLSRLRGPGFGGSEFDLAGSDRPQRQRVHTASLRLFSVALISLRL